MDEVAIYRAAIVDSQRRGQPVPCLPNQCEVCLEFFSNDPQWSEEGNAARQAHYAEVHDPWWKWIEQVPKRKPVP